MFGGGGGGLMGRSCEEACGIVWGVVVLVFGVQVYSFGAVKLHQLWILLCSNAPIYVALVVAHLEGLLTDLSGDCNLPHAATPTDISPVISTGTPTDFVRYIILFAQNGHTIPKYSEYSN